MKTIVATIIACLFAFSTFGQQDLGLKIIQGASHPNSELQQYYLLEVTNNSIYGESIDIKVDNTSCSNTGSGSGNSNHLGNNGNNQINISHKLYDKTQTYELGTFYMNPNAKVLFYVKVYREANTPTNKWNCKRIKASAKNGDVYSNAILIETLIPNPNNNN